MKVLEHKILSKTEKSSLRIKMEELNVDIKNELDNILKEIPILKATNRNDLYESKIKEVLSWARLIKENIEALLISNPVLDQIS